MANLLKSTAVVSFLTLLSRVLGLVRDVVLMTVFGASGLMDAFLVAYKIPNFLRRLFAEGAFSQAFVPVVSEYKNSNDFNALKIFIAKVFGTLFLLLVILTTGFLLFAPLIMGVFANGFLVQIDKFNLTVDLFRLTIPYVLLITLTAFASSVLQSYDRFIIPAITPILLNICFIIFAVWLSPFFDKPIFALGYAVLVAGVLQLLVQVLPLPQQRLLALPKVDFAHHGVKKILTLLLPALFSVSVLQINLLVNTAFASFLPTGSVSWLYTAERMSELPLGLIGVAIGTVILPTLAKSLHDKQQFGKTLDWACLLVLVVGLPASVALSQISDVLMMALFWRQNGAFGQHDALMSAVSLRFMALGILAFMLIKIFAPAFFVGGQHKIPVKAGLIAVVANILAVGALLLIFKACQIPLHGALALATTVSAWVNVLVLYYFLTKFKIFTFGKSWQKRFLQLGFANVIMVAALHFILPLFPVNGGQMLKILALLAICVIGALVYAVALLLSGFKLSDLKK